MNYSTFDKSLKEEYKKILIEEQFGEMPEAPVSICANIKREYSDFAGKALVREYFVRAQLKSGEKLNFPLTTYFPINAKNNKTVILVNNEDTIPSKFCPIEEIIDRGWNVANFNFLRFVDNSGRLDYENNKILIKKYPDSGKMLFWAWAISRAREFLASLEEVDEKNIGVVGNERAGRIALATASFDEKIAFVHANCSGTAGACLYESQTDQSQSIENVIMWFGWAFNNKFHEYFKTGKKRPFDQHLLGYLIAPRPLSVGCASEDLFTNPTGSFDFCKAVSNAYESYGEKGLVAPKEFVVGEKYHDGKVGYYCRKGTHFFGREDWNNMLDFFDKNLNK